MSGHAGLNSPPWLASSAATSGRDRRTVLKDVESNEDLYARLSQAVATRPTRPTRPDPRPTPGSLITATIESTDEERGAALLGGLAL